MSTEQDLVFFFDVDNTLLDNDRVQEDLAAHLEREFGAASRELYWKIFEQLRSELGYADYLARCSAIGCKTCTIPKSCECRPFWSTIPSPTGSIPVPLKFWRRAAMGADRDPVRRRRRLSAAQGRAIRAVERGRRPRADLHS